MPLLEDIESALAETDREIETLTDKRLKLEHLKKYKTSMQNFFDTDWTQTIETDRKSLKPFKYTITIANVRDINAKKIQININSGAFFTICILDMKYMTEKSGQMLSYIFI